MPSPLKPNRLQKGDTIAIIAPSNPLPLVKGEYMDWYLRGRKALESMGFALKEAPNLKKSRWWTGGTPEERAADINEMIADESVKAIICHDGGHTAIDLLEHLDYNPIRKNPKPLIGFSDITNLHLALNKKTGLVGFHMGLLSYSLGHIWPALSADDRNYEEQLFSRILTSPKMLGKIIPHSHWESWREGKAEGVLMGGNLSSLAALIGTPYFPSNQTLSKSILFWEVDRIKSYRIQRALYQLRYSGALDHIRGMIVGRLADIEQTAYGNQPEPSQKELVMDALDGYDFPVLHCPDFGHQGLNIPMPIGIQARIETRGTSLSFLEQATR